MPTVLTAALEDLFRRADEMEEEAELIDLVNHERSIRLLAKADGIRIAATEIQMAVTGPEPEVDCAAIKPGTEHDVIPVRCRALASDHPHPYRTHYHPALWPGTPDLLWEL